MLSLLFLLAIGAFAQTSQVPNLVIIMVDDLGYGDLPQFNPNLLANSQTLPDSSRKNLPNIDCLADGGLKFSDFHTAATLCTPSRAAMMTGRLPWRSQMTHDIFEVFTSASQLGGFPAAEVTIPEALKTAPTPYKTGMVGKWHLGVNDAGIVRTPVDTDNDGEFDSLDYAWNPNTPPTNPNRFDGSFLPQNQGFEYSELINTLGNFGSCAPQRSTETDEAYNIRIHSYCFLMGKGPDGQPRITEKPWDVEGLPQRMVNHFKTFLSTKVVTSPPTGRTAHPYFWYHAFMQVHTPYFASTHFKGKNDKDFTDMLEEMDFGVGLLMQAIKEHDATHNTKTVVIFTSDNGAFYEDYYDTTGTKDATLGQSSSLPYKGGKGVMFEGGSRVPTIAWSNDATLVQPGWNNNLFSMMDLFPTFMKLAGHNTMPPQAAPGPSTSTPFPSDAVNAQGWKPVDGFDISNHLKNSAAVSPWANRFLPYYCGQELQAGRFGDFKAIWTQQKFVDASKYDADTGNDLATGQPYNASRNPTPPGECDGGSCCPVPPGATGTCSCGDHIAFVDPDTGSPVIDPMQYRVAIHPRATPLLFNLRNDAHEDCNLGDAKDPDDNTASTVAGCSVDPQYNSNVGLITPWYDYYNTIFETRFPPQTKGGRIRKPRKPRVSKPGKGTKSGESSYTTPLALPPYYDELVQPHCAGQADNEVVFSCDLEPAVSGTPTGPIVGFCSA